METMDWLSMDTAWYASGSSLASLTGFFYSQQWKKQMRPKYSQVIILVKILQCEDANIQICCVTPTLGLCPGSELGAGVPEDGVHVQGGHLLQGHSSAEGSGGGVGQELQEGRHPGYRRRSQRCQHDQRYLRQSRTPSGFSGSKESQLFQSIRLIYSISPLHQTKKWNKNNKNKAGVA